MQKYNKAFGAIVGGIVGLLTVWGIPIPEQLATPEIQGAIVAILSTVGVYFAPGNKE